MTPDIKVMIGGRRCGKSKLMEAWINRIRMEDDTANIIHNNYNLTKYEAIAEYHLLEAIVEANYQKVKITTYL